MRPGTAIARFDPFEELSTLQNRLNQILRSDYSTYGEEGLRRSAWTPAVDIFETDDSIELTLEMPGVSKEDVNVSTENGQLTISGTRKLEHEDNRDGYHRIERSYGSFTRSFTLPSNVDASNIKATYNDGLLKLTLPRRPESKPRQIAVD